MRFARLRTSTIIQIVSLVCLAIVLIWQGYGFRFLSVQSDSMAPRFRVGDIVFIRNTTVYDTKVGDIVSVASLEDSSVAITHRVVAVDPIEGLVTTKGDANMTNDRSVGGQQLHGKVLTVIPGFGRLTNFLHSWWGVAAVVYIPMTLLVIREFIRLVRYYTRPTYQVFGRARDRF